MIKKYFNRRLYDTEQARYLTIAELAAMIVNGGAPTVMYAPTEMDITPEIYASILTELARDRLVTAEPLLCLIRKALGVAVPPAGAVPPPPARKRAGRPRTIA